MHTVAVAVLGLAVVDPDAQIVRYNAAATTDVDVAYLRDLSADAVPAMDRLEEPLRSCLLRRSSGAGRGPAGWNLGRHRAAGVPADADVDPSLACGSGGAGASVGGGDWRP